MPAKLSDRVTELETLLAFQERTMESLSEVLQAQQRQLDSMEKRLVGAEAKLGELHAGEASDPSSEPPPPHY